MKIKKNLEPTLFSRCILNQQPNANDLSTFIFHYKPQITSVWSLPVYLY